MIWDEVKELGPLYALGALDKETAEEIEKYLQEATPEQKREIRRWNELAALLPLALPYVSVPDYLRESLLSRISEESLAAMPAAMDETQTMREAETAATDAEIDEVIAQSGIDSTFAEADVINYEDGHEPLTQSEFDTPAESAESQRNVYTFKPARRMESRPVTWMLLAATVLLALATSFLLWQNVRLTKKSDELQAKLRDKEDEVVEKIASPFTKVIAMAGQQGAPDANAKVFWDTNSQQWAIHIYGLPAPPSDKEYQLWYVPKKERKEKPMSAAVFSTDQQGRTVLRLTLPRDVFSRPQDVFDRLGATAVTLEKKGGSEQPTGDILLVGAI